MYQTVYTGFFLRQFWLKLFQLTLIVTGKKHRLHSHSKVAQCVFSVRKQVYCIYLYIRCWNVVYIKYLLKLWPHLLHLNALQSHRPKNIYHSFVQILFDGNYLRHKNYKGFIGINIIYTKKSTFFVYVLGTIFRKAHA